MIIKKMTDVRLQDVTMDGAENVKVRVLFGPADQVPTFAMRLFELGPGGHTPFHSHPFEHEVVVLDGDIAAVDESGPHPVQMGQVLLVMPNEKHQFINRSGTHPARFLCLVPAAYQK
ncbi:MAG TPA: cupin domain-containing protein [Anaerohalosphaeraceae bacterium]|nr:cupin domain-containing protein [Anaerohalosphaeraceae bacterium]HOL31562.1 cupin domain-containing protein [Anaerohalosphaeraceae bacterium]HOM75989.1 cupin domain-containing protein [Anaerohalosphaeraceae bacterium]HPC63770.1 cupin domain-containing protein [Anaerohalosphaeraceae bacterium]HPO69835.1 cupin domain-containing protein [Anaerohalosphaeraceae bacterium]